MLFGVLLTWSEPVPLNGILSNYTIRYSVSGGIERTATTRDTSYSITNLDPSTVISNIRVLAMTGAGDGPEQYIADITTLEKPGKMQLYNYV